MDINFRMIKNNVILSAKTEIGMEKSIIVLNAKKNIFYMTETALAVVNFKVMD